MPRNTTGGGNKSSGGSSREGSKGQKSNAGVGGAKNHLEHLANKVPAHHAMHPMSGIYDTKGKFGNWYDGEDAFKG